MTSPKRSSLLQDLRADHGWQAVSWTARSLVAAAGVSVCVLLTALSATASVQKAKTARVVEAQLADEAALVAEFAIYLASETAEMRYAFNAPRLKPAKPAMELAALGPLSGFAPFDFGQLRLAEVDASERRCLAQAIYYEARSETRLGQLAVADVVLNRVEDARFPDTICGVVYEGSHRRNGCQFSFTCDGSLKRRVNARKWTDAEELAGAVLAGLRIPVSRQATHYHAAYVSPPWSKTLTPTASIGLHRFYRFPDKATVVASTAS